MSMQNIEFVNNYIEGIMPVTSPQATYNIATRISISILNEKFSKHYQTIDALWNHQS